MKFFLTIIILFDPFFLSAQIKVEDIKTDNDAARFVQLNFLEGNMRKAVVGGCVDSSQGFFYDRGVLKYIDSLGASKWVKNDFNIDGKDDLIYCGCINDNFMVLSFLSKKDHGYLVKVLSSRAESINPHFVHFDQRMKYLVIGRWNPFGSYADTTINDSEKYRYDTVKYSREFFIDKDARSGLFDVDTIELKYDVFLGRIKNKLIISRNGNIRFEKMARLNDTTYRMGVFVYEKLLNKDSVRIFFELANSLPYRKYFPYYNADYFDGFTWRTRIKLKSGKEFDIFDHMGVAPLSIRLFYEYAERRFSESDWKLVKVIESKPVR